MSMLIEQPVTRTTPQRRRSRLESRIMTHKGTKPQMKSKTSLLGSPTVRSLQALFVSGILGLVTIGGHAQAPAYVVTGWTTIATPASQSITGGSAGNYAVNSEGDFFYNDGAQHVIEIPANGGSPLTLFPFTSS